MRIVVINNAVRALLHAVFKGTGREVLKTIHFRLDGIAEASNGRILLRTKVEVVGSDLPEPICKLDSPEDVCVYAPHLERGSKAAKVARHPSLSRAFLVGDTIQHTDLDSTTTTRYKAMEHYPNTDQVIPSWKDTPTCKVTLSVAILDILLKASKTAGADRIVLGMGANESDGYQEPLTVEIKTQTGITVITGVVMPLR